MSISLEDTLLTVRRQSLIENRKTVSLEDGPYSAVILVILPPAVERAVLQQLGRPNLEAPEPIFYVFHCKAVFPVVLEQRAHHFRVAGVLLILLKPYDGLRSTCVRSRIFEANEGCDLL
jgi:hypothetical protein